MSFSVVSVVVVVVVVGVVVAVAVVKGPGFRTLMGRSAPTVSALSGVSSVFRPEMWFWRCGDLRLPSIE